MPSEPPSIPALKQSFLRSQIRLLTTPLTLPATLPLPSTTTTSTSSTTSSTTSNQPPPSQKLLTEILKKSNQKIKLHNKLVFSEQATRHVAEQVDALYWEDVLAEDARVEKGFVGVKRDVHYGKVGDVEGLPEGRVLLRDDDGGVGAGGGGVGAGLSKDEAKRYDALRGRLVELVRKRDEIRGRVNERKRVRGLMGPFEDAKVKVQGNLVTKDGKMARELGRLRVLLARVGEKVREMDGGKVNQGAGGSGHEEVGRKSEREKVVEVLGLT